MASVRGRGNRSTEQVIVAFLEFKGVAGWVTHPKDILGRPDIYFPDLRLAVFVDGCFWHGCPACKRNLPSTRAEFWAAKIAGNRRRDAMVTRVLRANGVVVTRVREHSLRGQRWQASLLGVFTRTRRLRMASAGTGGKDEAR